MGEKFTLSHITLNRVPLNGRPRSLQVIKRVINDHGISPADINATKRKLYDVDELSEAFVAVDMKRSPKSSNDNQTASLIEQKLKEQVSKLKQEQVLNDLKIKQLEEDLIDSEQVKQHLTMRYEIESSVLRRILLINAPIEIPGLTIPQARKKLEEYYNTIMEVLRETLLSWDGESELPDSIQKKIEILNNALLPKTESNNQ